ncbi:MAG: hypothetical protein K9N49_04090 [Candidatus Marinimicrobia bacterium]|nr:hypothetical protein [Candidatus Neomarinimicrobiota bacterium]
MTIEQNRPSFSSFVVVLDEYELGSWTPTAQRRFQRARRMREDIRTRTRTPTLESLELPGRSVREGTNGGFRWKEIA